MKITFWEQSGFSIETDEAVILVDYIGGGFEKDKRPVIALVSHGHYDHRAPEEIIFADRVIDCPDAGQEFEVMGAKIRTYGSTDEGVSFMIDIGGKRIFHAGDFNLWHWRDEGDIAWTKQATDDFYTILESLPGEKIDLAMFPVDPRMGSGYDEGACIFNERMKPGILIPMHWWKQPEAALKFAEKYNNVRALTESGQHMEI